MAAFSRFEDIDAWRNGRELVKSIYTLTSRKPFSVDIGLRGQIQRAAISICSNIAEGYGRRGNKEFMNFLWIAKGSTAEVASQLYHAQDLGYITMEEMNDAQSLATRISAELFSLIKYLSSHQTSQKI